jgi:hypothetical protein
MWMAHVYGMCPILWQTIWSICEPICYIFQNYIYIKV